MIAHPVEPFAFGAAGAWEAAATAAVVIQPRRLAWA